MLLDSVMSDSQPLTALEAAFVGLESRDVPFVHASILEFDRPIPLDALRPHVAAALAGVARYRQRIARGRRGTTFWVDDEDYRIDNQIYAAEVSAPGGARELDELVAQLIAAELPPCHPPWRVWTVAGLAGGRGAVISVFHHALVDGVAGFRLLEQVLGVSQPPAAPPVRPHRRPTRLAAVRSLVAWRTVVALARLLRDGVRPAAQLGLNPHHTRSSRVVASHTVGLDAVKDIERAFGVTNNDVVLATVAGALRLFLRRRGVDPDRVRDARAMVPVNRHARDEQEAAGNRVVLLLAPLPIAEADPVACLHQVSRATHQLKAAQTASGGDLLVALGDATTPKLLLGVLRISLRMRGFNVLVTNIPGPRATLSLLGARLTRVVPIANLWPHQAIGIAVASYAGALTFGLQADRAVVPNVADLRDDLAAAFTTLCRAAATEHRHVPAPASLHA